MTTLSVTDGSPAKVSADALVVSTRAVDGQAVLTEGTPLDAATVAHLNQALGALGAEGAADEVVRLHAVPGMAAPLVLAVGTGSGGGSGAAATAERLRRAAGTGARHLTGRSRAVFALGGGSAADAAAVAEGALLGSYAFQTFLGAGKAATAKPALGEAIVHGPKARSKEAKELTARAEAMASAVGYARDLVNTPPNVLYPESFAASVTKHAAGTAVQVEVWDQARLEKEGCGGIVGVGQGSGRGPRLVILRYSPRKPQARLAYVGKGITFDSGGLCIKPGASMVTMKCDMAGAAAVAAAILALAELGAPVEVTGYLCLAENMTGDLAQRPGDIVTMRGGKTVEIINTDAEGRLVMADGLALGSESTPDAIIDIATLTGAQVVALGERILAVMSNDDALRQRVHTAADSVGDLSWPMPLPEEIRATIDSPVADVKHTGERAAGMMTAAVFLQEFVGKDAAGSQLPWAHLDIAGPAFNEKAPWGYTPKGATGSGVRALVALAESYIHA